MRMKLLKTESKTVEFKTAFNQDTIESLVAFANADGGNPAKVIKRREIRV